MKIAIPTVQEKLCLHFGHCEVFTIYNVDENKNITSKEVQTPPPHEPGVLPKWLGEQNVDIIIAGGMGMRAQQLFVQNGVQVVVGASPEDTEKVVKEYLIGSLVTGDNVCDH